VSRISRRISFSLGLLLVATCWFVLPSLCSAPATPEEQVRAAVQQVATAAGQADLVAALEPVSRSYHDDEGLDFAMLRGLLFHELQARGPIRVLVGPMEVDVDSAGDRAEARFVALMLQGIEPAALDLRANDGDAWHFTAWLAVEEGEWRIVDHQRRPVAPQDVFR